jgi:hypothetical protein
MALADGIEGVFQAQKSFEKLGNIIKANTFYQKISTFVQKVWNAAMSANPIGTIIVVITALIAVGYKLITMFQESAAANDKAAAATKRNTNELHKQITANNRASEALRNKNAHELNMAKASGKSAEAIRKLALKHADEEVALQKASLATARNTYEKEKNTLASYKNAGVSDEIIAKQKELVTESRKNLQEETKELTEAYKNRKAVAQANQVEVKQEQTDAKKQAIDNAKSISEELQNNQKADLEKIKQNQREATDLFKAQYDLQVRAIQEKYAAEIALAKKYKKDTVDLEAARQKELKDLEDKQAKDLFDGTQTLVSLRANSVAKTLEFQEQEKAGLVGVGEVRQRMYDAEKLIEDTKRQNLTEALQATSATLGQIADLFGKQTTAGKAAAIAEATIQTFLSAQKAYASTVGIPVVGPVLAPINAGLAIAAGIKNIKAITAVKTPNGGGGGDKGGNLTNSFTSGAQAPNFNVVGNSGMNQLAQIQQQPIQAYVVSGEVTSAQALDRNRIKNATL